MTIDTLERLREHLQTAIELEHSTLAPYLCALYSIEEGHNAEAREVIESVVLEEMLHLTLAANLLNAVGGHPVLDSPALLPAHPTPLPHSDGAVMLWLEPFSPGAIEAFMAIERPSPHDALPEDDAFETIGQFYEAIERALETLAAQLGEPQLFCGERSRQVTDALYYGGAGRIIQVVDLASAQRALGEIVEQGEGLDHQSILDGDRSMSHPDRDEVAHYFRFQELLLGRHYADGDTVSSGPSGDEIEVDWSAVHPMRPNPRSSDYPPDSAIRAALDAFNRSYCVLLNLLEQCFNGNPALLAVATGAMYAVKQEAIALMRLPSGDGQSTVGPSFEWIAPERRSPAEVSIAVVPHGPYLVSGEVALHDAAGELRQVRGSWCLCRCGGSRSKPFCDGTHARIGFDGHESADHGAIADRRDAYRAGQETTIYDDRHRCAHFGQCSARLPRVFRTDAEPFVDPAAAAPGQIMDVVAGCPSGALAYALGDDPQPREAAQPPSIHPIVDGPYRVRGAIPVLDGEGRLYERRERQTLCRCGQSQNKPFCDGSHWYARFRDPLPPELVGAETLPWEDPEAAARGRERYAAERASATGTTTPGGPDAR